MRLALKLSRNVSLGEAPGRYLETGGVWSPTPERREELVRPRRVEVGAGRVPLQSGEL